MARINNNNKLASENKKTKQGNGKYSKKPSSGGERFYSNKRSGTPPSKARSTRKPYKGQGR